MIEPEDTDLKDTEVLLGEGRIPSLDGLRGISILLVTLCHVPNISGVHLPSWLKDALANGNRGVDVFFVVSGFLITHLLMRERDQRGTFSLAGFYRRRTMRIFPAYYVFLGVIAVMCSAGLFRMTNTMWALALTYAINLHADPAGYPTGHLWSLAVEEQFYLLWPLTLFILGARKAFFALMSAVLIAPIFRFVAWEYLRSYCSVDYFIFARMDTLAVGCLFAYFIRTQSALRLAQKIAPYATVVVIAAALTVVVSSQVLCRSGKYSLGPSRVIEATAIAMIVFTAITQKTSFAFKVLNSHALIATGLLSYSLYLGQAMLHVECIVPPWFKCLLAFIYALLSYWAVERPFLRLNDTRYISLATLSDGSHKGCYSTR